MFCNNCGKEIGEGKKFCGACGAPVATPEAPANMAQTSVAGTAAVGSPVYQPPVSYPPATPAIPIETKVGKEKYLWKKAPGGIKAAGIVGTLVGILCLAVCVAMFAQFIFGSILDYPIVKLSEADLGFDEDTFETEVKNLELELDRLEAELDNISDPEEKREAERMLELSDELLTEYESAARTPSIYNFYMMAMFIEEIGDELDDEIEYDKETAEQVMTGARNIALVIGAYGLLIILLTLFAVIFRNNFFVVPALILGFAFPFLFSGLLYGVLFVVGYIVFFILNIVVNSNYRKYKKAFKKAVA